MSTPTSRRVSGGRDDATPGPTPTESTPTEPAPTASAAATGRAGAAFDTQSAWVLNPKVALRPEPFGALLYHFGTRKLSFLKNLTVVGLVESLGDHASADAAMAAADIGSASRPQYVQALAALAESGMIVARTE